MECFMAITTAHKLLTDLWTGDVEFVETAVRRFKGNDAASNDCHIVLFEVARDSHLHVNVIHKYPTKSVPGWAGPGTLPDGFVHNRMFSQTQSTDRIVSHVRDMIFAAAA
jgi:hypothetical protein